MQSSSTFELFGRRQMLHEKIVGSTKKTYLSIIGHDNTLLDISFGWRNLELNQANLCIFYACWSTSCMTCFMVEHKAFHHLRIIDLSNTSILGYLPSKLSSKSTY